ncbi:exo-alpha-sialidase [Trypanosoma cruzi]|nr:exo-alpha-sialidase [Trypanosoma cruzi]
MAVRQSRVRSAACFLRANQRDTLDARVCLANSHRRHKREFVIHKATVIIILPTVHGAKLPCELKPICDILAIRHRCNHATALVDPCVGSACVGKISNQTHRTYGRREEGSVHVRPITGDGSDHPQLLRQGGRKQAAFLFIVPRSHKVQHTIRVQQGVGNRLIQSSVHESRSNTKHAVAVSHPNVERMGLTLPPRGAHFRAYSMTLLPPTVAVTMAPTRKLFFQRPDCELVQTPAIAPGTSTHIAPLSRDSCTLQYRLP